MMDFIYQTNFSIMAVLILIWHCWYFEKRMKVQDRQYKTLLSRLNKLTGRELDDP